MLVYMMYNHSSCSETSQQLTLQSYGVMCEAASRLTANYICLVKEGGHKIMSLVKVIKLNLLIRTYTAAGL